MTKSAVFSSEKIAFERSGVSRPAGGANTFGPGAKNVGAKTSVRWERPAAHLPGGLRRSAKTRSFTANLVYRRAEGDGWAGARNPLRVSRPARIQAALGVSRPVALRKRVAPGPRTLASKTSVRGEHPAAHLPGGLRRSAKTRSFTAILVYRRAVGDGWAGARNPLRVSECNRFNRQRPSLERLGYHRSSLRD